MAATGQTPDIVVRHFADHFQQFRMFAEEVLTNVCAVFRFVVLIFTVHGFHHHFLQNAVFIFCQQLIPATAPDDFHNIPACTTEIGFQFLNDFAVAAYRTIQTLQVTVNHDDQIVQLFTASHTNRTHGFRFIHLTVTAECPDFTFCCVSNTACMQVFQETCLINRHQRAQTHRYRRELPEVRHQFRMRVRRQTFAIYFATEVQQLLFRDTAFEESARINARCRVSLNIQQVTAVFFGRCMPEMVKANAQHIRQRCKGRQVTAEVAVKTVGFHHHCHRIPAHVRTQTFFDFQIARAVLTFVGRNRVDVGCVHRKRNIHTTTTRQIRHTLHQIVGAFRTLNVNHRFERIQPLLGFHHIGIILGLRQHFINLG